MKKLIIFGVGGILLKDVVNPLVDILGLLGKGDAGRKMQEEYERRKEKGHWGLTQYAELYCHTPKGELMAMTAKYLPVQIRTGVQDVIRELKKRGYIVGAISAFPDFVMETLKDVLNLDFSEGTIFEYKNGEATGRLSRELNRDNKHEIFKQIKKYFGVTYENVSIVANSITQIGLIKEVGRYISFNQLKELGYKSDFDVSDGDFRKLLEIFP